MRSISVSAYATRSRAKLIEKISERSCGQVKSHLSLFALAQTNLQHLYVDAIVGDFVVVLAHTLVRRPDDIDKDPG